MKLYKGELTNVPHPIVEKMCYYQKKQGNTEDHTIFENTIRRGHSRGGFNWADTPEGDDFWDSVINKQNWDLYFEKYPALYEVVHCNTQEEWDDVISKKNRHNLSSSTWKHYNNKSCIIINTTDDINMIGTYSSIEWFFKRNTRIYSYNEWCEKTNTVIISKNSNQSTNPSTNMPQQILKKDLIELYSKSTCNRWKEVIQLYLSANLFKFDTDLINITESHIKELNTSGSTEQKELVSKLGIQLKPLLTSMTPNGLYKIKIGNSFYNVLKRDNTIIYLCNFDSDEIFSDIEIVKTLTLS
jgi:hypothetical protein